MESKLNSSLFPSASSSKENINSRCQWRSRRSPNQIGRNCYLHHLIMRLRRAHRVIGLAVLFRSRSSSMRGYIWLWKTILTGLMIDHRTIRKSNREMRKVLKEFTSTNGDEHVPLKWSNFHPKLALNLQRSLQFGWNLEKPLQLVREAFHY